MSLSSLLGDRTSVLRQFLAANLPGAAAVRADFRARLPYDPDIRRPQPPPGVTPAWGTLGAAIDHRIRLALSDRPPVEGAVAEGIARVGAPRLNLPPGVAGALQAAGDGLLAELRHLVRTARPYDRSLTTVLPPGDEDRLVRACVVAVWFEEVYRSGKLAGPLTADGPYATLERLLAAVPSYVVDDVTAASETTYRSLASVRASCEPGQVHCGPTFKGSRDVAGADADWIAAGLLVDVKSSVAHSTLPLQDIQQLACYVLLDYDDSYRIQRVGWYLARIGVLVEWDVATFFGLLGASVPVSELRRTLADAVRR